MAKTYETVHYARCHNEEPLVYDRQNKQRLKRGPFMYLQLTHVDVSTTIGEIYKAR